MHQYYIRPLDDVNELEDFNCGVRAMDDFIHSKLQYSVANHYCYTYAVCDDVDEIVAFFALSFDSLELDSDDKDEMMDGISSTDTPDLSFEYEETFLAKPRFPSIDIAYLAVREKERGKRIGKYIVDAIVDMAQNQRLAGCQFLTVEALCTPEYSAVGFYDQCGFAPVEIKKAYKDTLRMFKTLYPLRFEHIDD